MQTICSLAAAILTLAAPAPCDATSPAAAAPVEMAGSQGRAHRLSLNEAQSQFPYGLPKPVKPPRIPRPKWP